MADRYIVLCGQIVGNMEDGFQVVYNWSGEFHDNRRAAIRAGWKERESDDFNIGVMRKGRLVDLAWMSEGGKATSAELRAIEDELGLAEPRP